MNAPMTSFQMKRLIGFFVNTFIIVVIASYFWAKAEYKTANYLFIAAGISTLAMVVWGFIIWQKKRV